MSKRELTPTEVEMGDVLRNGYMAPEVKFERLLAIVEALVNENLAPAMSRARAEALEEAAQCYEAWAAENCQTDSPTPEKRIRALITTSAPATIPAERVRKVLGRVVTNGRGLLAPAHVARDASGGECPCAGLEPGEVCGSCGRRQ